MRLTLKFINDVPHLTNDTHQFPCYIGKNGLGKTKEGDLKTPLGLLPMRRIFYRGEIPPQTGLEIVAIQKDFGWCDAPDHPLYNRLVKLPFDASHEKLWREDEIYDLVVELGYNDDPVIPGKGSAIFLHLKGSHPYTHGCISVSREDMLILLKECQPGSAILVVEFRIV